MKRVYLQSEFPLIIGGTIRENIVFGRKWREDKYFYCLGLCKLEEDLKALIDKDETKIGDGGFNVPQSVQMKICLA